MGILKYARHPKIDHNRRQMYKKYEINKVVLRSLLYSSLFNKRFKLYFFMLFQTIPKNSSISRLRTHCLLSGSGRYVIRKFKLDRYFVKQWASEGNIMGLRKSSF